jgi:hypothetical protein
MAASGTASSPVSATYTRTALPGAKSHPVAGSYALQPVGASATATPNKKQAAGVGVAAGIGVRVGSGVAVCAGLSGGVAGISAVSAGDRATLDCVGGSAVAGAVGAAVSSGVAAAVSSTVAAAVTAAVTTGDRAGGSGAGSSVGVSGSDVPPRGPCP